MREPEAREELVRICKMLYDRKLTYSAGGNVSVRVSGNVLITPSGVNKGTLAPEDPVLVDMEGSPLSPGKPSIETKFHLALYKKRPDVNAVVHCHPLYCTALSVDGGSIEPYTPEGALLVGEVAVVPYETPGSAELVAAVESRHGADAMIMRNHGALTQGGSLAEAFDRMEELEFQAMLQRMCSGSDPLPPEEVRKIRGGLP